MDSRRGQKGNWILLVALLGIATSVAAGDVWINCAPGFEVFLDGESMGVSERDESGKHLRGIESGTHTVRIENDGVALAEFSVDVGFDANQIVIAEIGPEITVNPGEPSDEEVETEIMGTVEITSDPRECNVKYGDQLIAKQHPILTIVGVPVGEHKFWFESSATVLSKRVVVRAAQPVRVGVDFRNRRVAITEDESNVEGGDSVAETPPPRAEPECIEYWVEVLRTADLEAIEPARTALKEQGFPPYHQKFIIVSEDGALPLYKLRVGPITRNNKARQVAALLRMGGFKTAWVVPEECQ